MDNIFQEMFQSHSSVLMLIDAVNDLIIDANLAAERFYGYPRHVLINMNFSRLNILPPEAISLALKKSAPERKGVFEFQHRLASGEFRSVEVHSTPIQNQKPSLLFLIIQDITERKHITAELSKLSQAVEQSPAAIAITDLNGTLEYVNPAFCNLTGFAVNELLGNNPRVLKSGVTSAEEYQLLWKTITGGGTWQGEFCNKKKNGEFYWERARIAPIRDKEGAICNFVAIKEDITAQKQAESSLQKANRLLQKTISCLNEAVFIVDATNRRIIDVNICAEMMFGYAKEEMLGEQTSTLHLNHEMYQWFGEEMLRSYLKTGNFQTSYQMKRKDGTIFQSEHYVTPIVDGNGNYECHVCVVRDISARIEAVESLKKAMSALEERKTFVESIISNLHSGLIVTDLDWRVTMANPYVLDLCRTPAGDLNGRALQDICPELADQITAGMNANEITSHFLEAEFTIGYTRIDLKNANGERSGHIINFRDLTEIAKIRAMIQQKERLSAMGEVVAGVAHEMRNPLFGMTTIGQIFNMELDLSPQHRQLMDSFMKESQRLNNLILDLLDGTRELKLRKKPVNLVRVIDASILVCQKYLQEKNIDLTRDHPRDGEPEVLADPEKLEQIFVNLIHNAIDASEPGGRVEIVMKMGGDPITVMIIDSGHGIPEKILPNIFDVFFTSKKGGTGMGLYISKNIAEAHGGTLTAENITGKGASFRLELPLSGATV